MFIIYQIQNHIIYLCSLIYLFMNLQNYVKVQSNWKLWHFWNLNSIYIIIFIHFIFLLIHHKFITHINLFNNCKFLIFYFVFIKSFINWFFVIQVLKILLILLSYLIVFVFFLFILKGFFYNFLISILNFNWYYKK